MTADKKTLVRRIATRSVISVLPVAMASAYASGIFLSPPREVKLDSALVAEITNTPSTVGVADSALIYKSPAEINKTLDELQALGVNNIRVLVPWAIVEQTDNVYYWTQMDAVMTAAAARNMGVMADINSTPLWAAAPNTFPGAGAPSPAKFAEFVQQVVTRYGNTISAYEIWNEPNWAAFYQPVDPVAYTALLAAVYPIIKNPVTGDPTATVVAGALGAGQTTPWTLNPVDFVAGMMAAGAAAYFDALSFHPYQETLKFSQGYNYPGLGTPLEQLDAIKALIGATKTVWISEYGLPTSSVTQQQQSDFVKDLLDYWQTYGQTGPVFLYTAVDNQTGSTNPEDNFGLFTSDWTRKVAAEMLRAWIAAHPQTPVVVPPVTGPPQPNPIVALLQQIGQQIQQAINGLVTLGQSLVSAVNNLVSAITNAIRGIFSPQTPAATVSPLTLRVASVEASSAADPAEASVDGDVTAARTAVAVSDPTTGEKVAAPVAEATKPVETAPVEVAPVVVEPVVVEPVVVEPVVVEPVTKPVVVEPVTKPVTKPVATEPAAAETPEPATETPSGSTTPATAKPATGTSSSTTAKPGEDEHSSPAKSGTSGGGTSAGSESGSAPSSHPSKGGERHSNATAGGSASEAGSSSGSESSGGSSAGGAAA